ncbi:hypothetical protein SE17_40595, partial [Kouleothrix aurantiaca]
MSAAGPVAPLGAALAVGWAGGGVAADVAGREVLGAGGAGALAGAFAMASVRQLDRYGRGMIISGIAFCALLTAFALCPFFVPGVVLLVLVGIASTVFTTLIATVIQLRVPGELRGRVMSLYAITLIGLPSLGALGVAAVAHGLAAPSEGRPI